MKHEVKLNSIDCFINVTVICPFCGHSYKPSDDGPLDKPQTCSNCKSVFNVEVGTLTYYTTRPLDNYTGMWNKGDEYEGYEAEEKDSE